MADTVSCPLSIYFLLFSIRTVALIKVLLCPAKMPTFPDSLSANVATGPHCSKRNIHGCLDSISENAVTFATQESPFLPYFFFPPRDEAATLVVDGRW